ncbi:Canalicular multispecific organic anion transporter 1 [Homalodisca vitripennis]|nr:Canalicular multispecific organic anion transporter 1 [Homalodisca vitripennis]
MINAVVYCEALKWCWVRPVLVLALLSALGEISSAPPNCNSITYKKRLPAPLFVRRPWAVAPTASYPNATPGKSIQNKSSSFLESYPSMTTTLTELMLMIQFVDSKEYMWRGFAYAISMFICAELQSIFFHQHLIAMYRIGLNWRTAITFAVYKKSLRISNAARKRYTMGEVVNMMAVDAQRCNDFAFYFHFTWTTPFIILAALYFLWQMLGPAALAGLSVMLIIIPINALIAKKVKLLQMEQMTYKDERVKQMNEVLTGIKVLKLYAWDPSFRNQILKIREKEIRVLKSAAMWNASISFLWLCSSFLVKLRHLNIRGELADCDVNESADCDINADLNERSDECCFESVSVVLYGDSFFYHQTRSKEVSLVTFAVFVMIDERNVLTPEIAFVATALFNIMRAAIGVIPLSVNAMLQKSLQAADNDKKGNLLERSLPCPLVWGNPILVELLMFIGNFSNSFLEIVNAFERLSVVENYVTRKFAYQLHCAVTK